MNKSLILLTILSSTLLIANVKVLRGLKEVDVQCSTHGVVIQRSKLIVTKVIDKDSYLIHRGASATQYHLPTNCEFSTSPKNYVNEVWGTKQ